jgi:hypothetical protein
LYPSPPPSPEDFLEEDQGHPMRYYFYQLATGENIYLHSLNITWLLKEFGDYAHFPDSINGKVLDIEDSITQDEARDFFLNFFNFFLFFTF